jgi:DNA-binding NarL/FixJ family response regulator
MAEPEFTVLVIDDHSLFRSGIKMILKSEFGAVQTMEADSVEFALRETAIRPDLILLDVRLEGLSGLESISLLQRRWPKVKVIMLSSDHSPRTVEQAFERGALGFIFKANASEQMMATIRSVMAFDGESSFTLTTTQPQHAASVRLTARQCEVLGYLNQGMPNKLIARRLDLSENTVRGHVQSLLVALDASSRSEAVFQAKRLGLLY